MKSITFVPHPCVVVWGFARHVAALGIPRWKDFLLGSNRVVAAHAPHPLHPYIGLHLLPSSGILRRLPGGKSKLSCAGVSCSWVTKCHFLVKPNSSHASEDSGRPQRRWYIYNPHAHMSRRVSAWLCRRRPCRSSAAAAVFISEQTHSCKLTFLPVWHLRLVFISPGNLAGRVNESLFIYNTRLLAGLKYHYTYLYLLFLTGVSKRDIKNI